jgi:hypothetical protein
MRVAIYARVSTEAQEARGTIGSQLEALRARADELRRLIDANEDTREVPAFLPHRERKRNPSRGKSDLGDAVAIARVVARGDRLSSPQRVDVLSDLNWLAVIVAAIAYFAIGALWYAPPVFGRIWMTAGGMAMPEAGTRRHRARQRTWSPDSGEGMRRASGQRHPAQGGPVSGRHRDDAGR